MLTIKNFERYCEATDVSFDEADKLVADFLKYYGTGGNDARYEDEEDYYRFVRDVYVVSTEGNSENFLEWLKEETRALASNGTTTFVGTVDKLINFTGTFARKLKNRFTLSRITDQRLNNVFEQLEYNIKIARTVASYKVQVVPYRMAVARLEGCLDVISQIEQMGDNMDKNAFDSDKTYDNLANSSNGLVVVKPPLKGAFFRSLERQKPIVKQFELLQCEWGDTTKLDEFKKLIVKVKADGFERLNQAMNTLKQTLSGLKGEVSHTRQDNGEEMVVEYARSYIAVKFAYQLQSVLVGEILYDITAIPKMLTRKDIHESAAQKADKSMQKEQELQNDKSEKDNESTEKKEKSEGNNEEKSEESFSVADVLKNNRVVAAVSDWVDDIKKKLKQHKMFNNKKEYTEQRDALLKNYEQFLDSFDQNSAKNATIQVYATDVLQKHFEVVHAVAHSLISADPFRLAATNDELPEDVDHMLPEFYKTLNKLPKAIQTSIRSYSYHIPAESKIERRFLQSGWDDKQVFEQLKSALLKCDETCYSLYNILNGYLDRLTKTKNTDTTENDDTKRTIMVFRVYQKRVLYCFVMKNICVSALLHSLTTVMKSV